MNTNNYNNVKSTRFDYKIIAILILIVIIICYLLFFQDLFKNPYVKKEEEMVKVATDYVIKNGISTNTEIYLDVSKLDIDLPNECNITSGVIYDGANYTPNLVCNEYKSVVISSNKEIEDFVKLKGDEVMIIPKGTNYYEPGYISNDIVDSVGNVGTEEGVYNIFYKTKNSNNLAIRKVIIIDNPAIKVTFPTISLIGEEVIYVVQGKQYDEPGFTGRDIDDGNISNRVIIEGDVNTSVPGEYTITYILTNSKGNSNTITRKVNVISDNGELVIDYRLTPENYTNQSVTIKLSISDEYEKIIYPDGSEGTNLIYTVHENGIYNFSVYDMYGRITTKSIEVNNIDKTLPEGTCTATAYYNRTEVKVSVTTEKAISSYEYLFNNNSVATIQSNYYSINQEKPTIVNVKIKDSIGNTNTLSCNIIDQTVRNVVTDSKGKNCLEGYKCYIQWHYTDEVHHLYCSYNRDDACGSIAVRGCSITSLAIAASGFNIKSPSGKENTPYVLWEETYPINKNTGRCNAGCSSWSRIIEGAFNLGLSASPKVTSLNKNTISILTDHLNNGYPAVVHARKGTPGGFAGGGHYLAVIGIRNDGYVFISDPATYRGTNGMYYNGKQYHLDTYIPPEDLITGNIDEFILIGPKGYFQR